MGQCDRKEYYAFAKNLRKLRIERGLSQRELAVKSNITQASISYYEECIKYPAIDKLYDLAKALDVSVNELISG